MISYGNNEDPSYINTPEKDNLCRSHTNHDVGLYHSLVSITYSGCNEKQLEYEDCQHEQKTFKTGIMAISNNLGCAVDTTRCPCVIFGKVSHTFEESEELQDPIAIQKPYIQLRVALQKIKEMEANQSRHVNSLISYKLSYVNSANLVPPQLPIRQDLASLY